jgi:hypothetical protein
MRGGARGRWRRSLAAGTLGGLLVLGASAATPAGRAARVEASGGEAAPAAALAVKLRIRVAACDGQAAPAPAWIEEHVEAVKALLAPHGITVSAEQAPFAPGRCQALDRKERDAFAEHVTMDGAVTVLVLARVRDLDVRSYDLMGVHWRAGGRRWIFLTARARPPVLAHELGHYFGLPHDPAGGNLMTPGPSSPLWRSPTPPRPFQPVLTAAQVARLREGIVARRR